MADYSALDRGLRWLREAYNKEDLTNAFDGIAAEDGPLHDTEAAVAVSGVIAAAWGCGGWEEAVDYLRQRLSEK